MTQIVVINVSFQFKPLVTLGTTVWLVIRVDFFMRFQIVQVVKGLETFFTLELYLFICQ